MLLTCLLATLLTLALAMRAPAGDADTIRIATWNMEWLVSPTTAHAARLACRSGQRDSLPCDVAEDARDSADLARLAAYVRELDADIIAFQEVENEGIAGRVFRDYRICMANGSGAQHVGFAVRPQLPHRCGPMVESLALEGRSRKGMSLQLTPASGPPIELLAVHLKSGCSRDPLETDSMACSLLQTQAGHLATWVEERSAQGSTFIVLGDFNRVPPAADDDVFWQPLLSPGTSLLTAQLPFRNCQLGQPYLAYIDHILVSNNLRGNLVPASESHQGFRHADGRYQLSDHCPVSVSLKLAKIAGRRTR